MISAFAESQVVSSAENRTKRWIYRLMQTEKGRDRAATSGYDHQSGRAHYLTHHEWETVMTVHVTPLKEAQFCPLCHCTSMLPSASSVPVGISCEV